MTKERRAEIETGLNEIKANEGTVSWEVDAALKILAELAAVEAERDAYKNEVLDARGLLEGHAAVVGILKAQLPTPEMVRAAAVNAWHFGTNRQYSEDEIGKLIRIIADALGVDMSPAAPTKENAS
jgi:hypothetical protein